MNHCKKHQPKECEECIKEGIAKLEVQLAELKKKLPSTNFDLLNDVISKLKDRKDYWNIQAHGMNCTCQLCLGKVWCVSQSPIGKINDQQQIVTYTSTSSQADSKQYITL